ncbi:phosphatase PAP2 family protein [Bifidobacterium imperatoris]|uniref:Acid phosphatase n=1 Tax=Bifidobacterium imperatoris TaxID=2020965 RepID=A0A2N5IQ77_9BIFI|nr:phosphatase PAP2 family protein [Bifidobacterium imperatoris]PLS24109.1 Acid phosphatase [Bifidobacterium imperatoris]QSY58230.1 phosphatase PAP2 family protein [Bifidobacterium imperatoris]
MSVFTSGKRALAALAAVATLAASFAAAVPAMAEDQPVYPSDSTKANPQALLKEFNNYWVPVANPNNDETTVFRGDVTDAGASILKENDDLTVAINNKAADDDAAGTKVDEHYTQLQKALIDGDQNNRETFVDAFGPIMGEWFWDGMVADPNTKTRALQKTYDLLNGMVGYIPVTGAKYGFNYPRPSLNKTTGGDLFDRSANGKNDLKGLQAELPIQRAADWDNPWQDPFRGLPHGAGYSGLAGSLDANGQYKNNPSQSFPSGHTMAFYTSGLTLAAMMPEFAPQIAARAAEGGNNRIVLGVHYPLDVIGGRIVGEASAAGRLNDDVYFEQVIKPAQQELRDYLTKRGQEAGYGNTLEEIIANTKANTTNGYKNLNTDAVATEPVTDVKSAVDVYTERLTYGFQPVGATNQAARVPAGAEALLRTVFPTLTADQRREVLARTEIQSGYPFDSTSDGWQRLNLAAAFSSKVTLDANGNVTNVEPGQQAQVIKQENPNNNGNPNTNGGTNNNNSGTNNQNQSNGNHSNKPKPNAAKPKAAKSNGNLANSGADVSVFAGMTVLFLAAGAALAAVRRMRNR